MSATPPLAPVTVPVLLTVAIDVLLLLHVPPVPAFVKVVVFPEQIFAEAVELASGVVVKE